MNGRADIAIAAGAHGVHLPSAGLHLPEIKPWLPTGFIVGVSTHSTRDAVRAAAQGADYVLLGPVFPTESKLRFGPPLGMERFRRACRAVPIPVLGLGGIHPGRIPAVLAAGAAGVAGISLFQNDVFFAEVSRL